MINIILKNKRLIKLYRGFVILFKFLNKHLYLLSIITLIKRSRSTALYKAISLIIKMVVLINLIISSGLFFSFLDLQTPLMNVYSFYDEIIKPFYDYLIEKFNDLIGRFNELKDLDSKDSEPKIDNYYYNSKGKFDDVPMLETKSSKWTFSLKDYISFFAFAFLLYFLFGVPGPSIDPTLVSDYNFINKSLIGVKKLLVDVINYFIGGNGSSGSGGNTTLNKSSMHVHFDDGVELNNFKSDSSNSGPSTSESVNIPSSSKGKARDVGNMGFPGTNVSEHSNISKIDSGVQTELGGVSLHSMLKFVQRHLENTVEKGIQTKD